MTAPEFAPEVPADEGTLAAALDAIQAWSAEPVEAYNDPHATQGDGTLDGLIAAARSALAAELQKARVEVIDWMDASHGGLGEFDQTVFNAREHFGSGSPERGNSATKCFHEKTHMRGWTQVCDNCGLGREIT